MNPLRRLQRRPAQTLLVLLAVFFGSAAITLSLSAYFGSPQFRPELADRFELTSGWRSREETNFHPLFVENDLEAVQALAPAVERLAIFGRTTNFWPFYPQVAGELYEFPDSATVSAAYFEIMGMTPGRGSFFTEADRGRNTVVVSEGAARMLFGTDNAVDQEIGVPSRYDTLGRALSARIPFMVVGTFPDADLEALRTPVGSWVYTKPLLLFPAWSQGVGPIHAEQETLLAQARPGQEEAARTQLLAAVRQVYEDEISPDDTALGRDFYLTEPGEGAGLPADFIDPSVVLFGVFGIVALLTSTIGVFSAGLTDVLARTRELGVRRALGASRRRVALSLAGEASLVALVGGVLGVLAAALVVPLMATAVGESGFGNAELRWRPLAGLIALALVGGLSFVLNLVPAWQAVRASPVEALGSN